MHIRTQDGIRPEANRSHEGLGAWLVSKLRHGGKNKASLNVVDRIALAPRQSLALIEAEGRRILVATSAAGTVSFFPLDENKRPMRGQGRVSW